MKISNQTLILGGVLVAVAGYFVYTKVKKPKAASAPATVAGGGNTNTSVLGTAAAAVGASATNALVSWLTGVGNNTASTNSNSGVIPANTGDANTTGSFFGLF